MTTAEVRRYRVNDYVGSPIWGFRAYVDLDEGDRVYFDDTLFNERRFGTVVNIDNRLAIRLDGGSCGFLT